MPLIQNGVLADEAALAAIGMAQEQAQAFLRGAPPSPMRRAAPERWNAAYPETAMTEREFRKRGEETVGKGADESALYTLKSPETSLANSGIMSDTVDEVEENRGCFLRPKDMAAEWQSNHGRIIAR